MRILAASCLCVMLASAPARADDGRAARVAGIVLWAASGAALAVGIVAWREQQDYQNRAHADLSSLAPDNANSPANLAWFASPNCSPPSTIMGNTSQYRSDCTTGQGWSGSATAMFVLAPALAAAGTVSYVVGARRGERRAADRVQLLPTGLRVSF